MAAMHSAYPGTTVVLEPLSVVRPLATTRHFSIAQRITHTNLVGNYWSHFLWFGSEVVTGGTFWMRKENLVQRHGL